MRPGSIEAAWFFPHRDATLFCPRHKPTLNSEAIVSLAVNLLLIRVPKLRKHFYPPVVHGGERGTYQKWAFLPFPQTPGITHTSAGGFAILSSG